MATKLTGELRLDLTQPGTAEDLGELLADLDEQGVERSKTVLTLQPAVEHQGGWRDPLATPRTAGMQLVVTWSA